MILFYLWGIRSLNVIAPKKNFLATFSCEIIISAFQTTAFSKGISYHYGVDYWEKQSGFGHL